MKQAFSCYVPVISLKYLPPGLIALGVCKLILFTTLLENLHFLLERFLHLKPQHFKTCYFVSFVIYRCCKSHFTFDVVASSQVGFAPSYIIIIIIVIVQYCSKSCCRHYINPSLFLVFSSGGYLDSKLLSQYTYFLLCQTDSINIVSFSFGERESSQQRFLFKTLNN